MCTAVYASLHLPPSLHAFFQPTLLPSVTPFLHLLSLFLFLNPSLQLSRHLHPLFFNSISVSLSLYLSLFLLLSVSVCFCLSIYLSNSLCASLHFSRSPSVLLHTRAESAAFTPAAVTASLSEHPSILVILLLLLVLLFVLQTSVDLRSAQPMPRRKSFQSIARNY